MTDGYAAYASYAKKVGIAHAQCWTHARREIFKAEAADPENVREGLRRIGVLYDIEEEIGDQKLWESQTAASLDPQQAARGGVL